jgi:signal transduction histidine kinase/ActR/RegA family two-component response regulator
MTMNRQAERAPPTQLSIRAALDRMTEAMVICDRHGRVLFANAQAERRVGRFLALVRRGRSFIEAVAEATRAIRPDIPEDELSSIAEQVKVDMNALVPVRARADDGAPLDIRSVRLADGQFVAVLVDMTEQTAQRSELIRALDRAERGAEARAAQMAELSHELRTPLNGVLGMTRALLDEDLSPRQREIALTLSRSSTALVDLLGAAIERSREPLEGDALELSDCAPLALLEDAVALWRPMAEAKGLRLTLHADPDLPALLRLDALRFGQCLNNLIANAVNYSVAGAVDVHAAAEPAQSGGALLRLCVADQGPGVDAALLNRLFEPYSRGRTHRARAGSGLGLAVTRRLARLHGGDVQYQDRDGGGACFTLHLRAWPPQRPAPGTDTATRGATALIVDDDSINRSVTRHMLDALGLTLREASSGAEALAAIRDAPPDLLLLDMKLQDMHGSDVLRVAAALPDAPEILVLSGEEGAEALTLPMGARAALSKPLDLSLLRDAVRGALDHRARLRPPPGAPGAS